MSERQFDELFVLHGGPVRPAEGFADDLWDQLERELYHLLAIGSAHGDDIDAWVLDEVVVAPLRKEGNMTDSTRTRLLLVAAALVAIGGLFFAFTSGDDSSSPVVTDQPEVVDDDSSGVTEPDDAAIEAPFDGDVCELITEGDLAARGFVADGEPSRSGGTLARGLNVDDFDIAVCVFRGPSDGDGTVTVGYAPPSSAVPEVVGSEPVEGLGAAAIYSAPAGLITVTLPDSSMITIQTFYVSEDLRDFLIGLAEVALERL